MRAAAQRDLSTGAAQVQTTLDAPLDALQDTQCGCREECLQERKTCSGAPSCQKCDQYVANVTDPESTGCKGCPLGLSLGRVVP